MTEDMSEVLTRRDIEGVTERVAQLQRTLQAVSNVGDGLQAIGDTVTDMTSNLELAISAQQVTEDARRFDAKQSRERFWYTIGGIVLANVIVIVISLVVLFGQISARETSDVRAKANRDRQSCSTSLLVEWDAKLGNALRLASQVPPVPRDSPEYLHSVKELNDATDLISRAKELCYGPIPNPDPVPG